MTLHANLFLVPAELPVPQDRPFTTREAAKLGITARQLTLWTQGGLLATPMRGVHHVVTLADCLELRIACVALVLPPGAVVCDRTAAWLMGAPMILAPNAHLQVPAISVYCPPGNRLRNPLTSSGERFLSDDDVIEVGGILVTTALRTTCDLGRLLHRDQAFAALCSLLTLDQFTLDELLASVDRFKGYRGVRQLRELAPDADPRPESPEEAILLRRWLDCADLPRPELQIPVQGPDGPCRLDMGLPEVGYAAEYDGEQWHGPEEQEHDESRRSWISRNGGWIIDPLRKHNLHGATRDVELILRAGVRRALGRRRR
jgi:hypothetical protein